MVKVVGFVVPHIAFTTGPYYVGCRSTGAIDEQQQLFTIDLKVVVDTLETARLQIGDVGCQPTCTLCYDIGGSILSGEIDGKIVGALEREVALNHHPATLIVGGFHFYINLTW